MERRKGQRTVGESPTVWEAAPPAIYYYNGPVEEKVTVKFRLFCTDALGE